MVAARQGEKQAAIALTCLTGESAGKAAAYIRHLALPQTGGFGITGPERAQLPEPPRRPMREPERFFEAHRPRTAGNPLTAFNPLRLRDLYVAGRLS